MIRILSLFFVLATLVACGDSDYASNNTDGGSEGEGEGEPSEGESETCPVVCDTLEVSCEEFCDDNFDGNQQSCDVGATCAEGLLCVNFACRTSCDESSQCESGEVCQLLDGFGYCTEPPNPGSDCSVDENECVGGTACLAGPYVCVEVCTPGTACDSGGCIEISESQGYCPVDGWEE